MLDKLKVTMLVGLVLQAVRLLFPGLDIGEEFGQAVEALVASLYVIIPVVAGWFVKESANNVRNLELR